MTRLLAHDSNCCQVCRHNRQVVRQRRRAEFMRYLAIVTVLAGVALANGLISLIRP